MPFASTGLPWPHTFATFGMHDLCSMSVSHRGALVQQLLLANRHQFRGLRDRGADGTKPDGGLRARERCVCTWQSQCRGGAIAAELGTALTASRTSTSLYSLTPVPDPESVDHVSWRMAVSRRGPRSRCARTFDGKRARCSPARHRRHAWRFANGTCCDAPVQVNGRLAGHGRACRPRHREGSWPTSANSSRSLAHWCCLP